METRNNKVFRSITRTTNMGDYWLRIHKRRCRWASMIMLRPNVRVGRFKCVHLRCQENEDGSNLKAEMMRSILGSKIAGSPYLTIFILLQLDYLRSSYLIGVSCHLTGQICCITYQISLFKCLSECQCSSPSHSLIISSSK